MYLLCRVTLTSLCNTDRIIIIPYHPLPLFLDG